MHMGHQQLIRSQQCHLRLAHPSHTDRLVRHFTDNPTVQSIGLDGDGVPASNNGSGGGQKPIVLEAVTGEREELYWAKVPEKVRRQAVEKAVLGGTVATAKTAAGDGGGDGGGDEGEGPKRKRRRRR